MQSGAFLRRYDPVCSVCINHAGDGHTEDQTSFTKIGDNL